MHLEESLQILQGLPHRDRNLYRRVKISPRTAKNEISPFNSQLRSLHCWHRGTHHELYIPSKRDRCATGYDRCFDRCHLRATDLRLRCRSDWYAFYFFFILLVILIYVGTGRRIAFVLTMTFAVIGSIASSLAFDYNGNCIYYLLFLARFWLGVGIGGEYPLAASISSEASEANKQQKHRGKQVSAVFSMQGIYNVHPFAYDSH